MQNFRKYRGDTITLTLAFTDSLGVAINITGWTIWLTLKKNIDDADGASTSLQVKATITNGVGGLASITLTSTQTALLEGTYYYDIQYKNSTSDIKTVLDGKFIFKKDITITTTP